MLQNIHKEKHQHDVNSDENELMLDQGYKQIPMDLNSSPLEEYFREILSKSNMNSNQKMTSAAKPVSIPGTLTTKIHENKQHFAHTFPLMNDIQYQQQNTRQKTHNTSKFIVGSLVEEKPPVPWPTSLLTTHSKPHADTKYRHLKNIRNTNWPPHQNEQPIDNESDVFSMDEDVDDIQFNDSDFDDDIDIDENYI